MKIKHLFNIKYKIKTIKKFLFYIYIHFKSTSFYLKLNALIKYCSFFYYPEKYEYFPDYGRTAAVEKSQIKKLKRRINAWNKASCLFNLNEIEKAYKYLEDEYSKEMFIMVIAYQLFDSPGLRFPLYYSQIWNNLNYYEKMICSDEKIPVDMSIVGLGSFILNKFNLNKLNFNLTVFVTLHGLLVNFVNQQYKYKNLIEAENGDCVIDGGACFGETSLYFSEKVGQNGNVYAFEFIDSNIDIFNKNIELNQDCKKRIKLVKRPRGNDSSEIFYSYVIGPASYISKEKKEGFATEVQTISIDDFVKEYNINKIDFIKLDIEGYELNALKGAIKTLKKFKPKLAICVYHKPEDLWEIPKFLRDNFPEYKLYLDHYTIMSHETVLYAKI